MAKCFVAMSENLLQVLFDLPGDWQFERCETTRVHNSDGSVHRVHLFYFDQPDERFDGKQIDLQYRVNEVGATSLHSFRYSSGNREGDDSATQGQDARRTGH